MPADYYKVLGVRPDASVNEIRTAYKRKALAEHPDRFPDSQRDKQTKKFQRVNDAYYVLSDTSRRRDYDLSRPDSDTSSDDHVPGSFPDDDTPGREYFAKENVDEQFGGVFEEMLHEADMDGMSGDSPQSSSGGHIWGLAGGFSGAVLGFILANVYENPHRKVQPNDTVPVLWRVALPVILLVGYAINGGNQYTLFFKNCHNRYTHDTVACF